VAVELVVDELHPGTNEQIWLGASCLAGLRPLMESRPRRLVVVAPHPDDEVLGAGGLLQRMERARVETVVIAVTDGEASHPGARLVGCDLSTTRALERRVALNRLGCRSVRVSQLRFPDGAVAEQVDRLTDLLSCLLRPDDLCVSPWRSDGHPDHDACGRAAAAAAASIRVPVLEYLVWAWHWANPENTEVPWRHCRRLELERRQTARKRWATYAFTSQIRPFPHDHDGRPLLPDSVLRRFWRSFEVFVDGSP
jgi:LmbE family N-acetylglucosaminyl deacetylase